MPSTNLDAWEEQSTNVLSCIRCLIDALRSAPYPAEISGTQAKRDVNHIDAELSLVDHLRSAGVFDSVAQLHKHGSDDIDASPSHLKVDERRLILHQLVFPLLTNLQDCYEVLDNAPQSTAPVARTTSGRNNNKPQPTKGMLSLNDYTNVACLLEFTMCMSLLPQMGFYAFLDEAKELDRCKAMTLAQKRSRALPKSLAGRIPGLSLAWGMHAAPDGWSKSTQSNYQTASTRIRAEMLHQNCKELSQLAITVGRLVLLDRFRPMLLPRHLADLYMTLLFYERCKWNLVKLINSDLTLLLEPHEPDGIIEEKMQCLQTALLFTPPMEQSIKSTVETELKSIDYREAALACRTLLGGEAAVIMSSPVNETNRKQDYILKIPPWIRMRLGQCLTKLADGDLHAVVDVFVASARGIGSESTMQDEDVMTGAAARLARALCARPSTDISLTSSSAFRTNLCNQFIDFLVAEGESMYKKLMDGIEESKNEVTERKLSRSCLAMMYTLWALISELSEQVIQSCFVIRLSSGLVPLAENNAYTGRLTALQSTASICVWMSGMPSYLDQSTMRKMHSILLTNILPTTYTRSDCTILGQILRLAGSFRQACSESKLVMEINSGFCSNNASQLMTEISINRIVCGLLHQETHVYSIALEMVKAVAADELDREGYAFGPLITNPGSSLPDKEYSSGASVSELKDLLQGVERRSGVLVDAVVAPTAAVIDKILVDDEDLGALDRIVYTLPTALFRLVLMIHFYTLSSTNEDSIIAAKINAKLSQYGLLDLLKKDFHSLRITSTVMLGLICEKCAPAAILFGKLQGENEVNSDIIELLAIIIDCAASQMEQMERGKASNDTSSNPHELFSTAPIVVSLLVSLLELGSSERSAYDEEILQSMMSSLQVLSISKQEQFRFPKESDPEVPTIFTDLAELAEMSSHAMALIAARKCGRDGAETNQKKQYTSKRGLELIAERLSQAEHDLESSQPPLRARGVVSLRHIARSFDADDATSGVGIGNASVLVAEMESAIPDQTELVARSLARLSFAALSDTESYVYLASIQTLVAICDMCPHGILPLTATLVAKGAVGLTVLSAEAKVVDTTLTLSPEQRIKSAEALIFMIRRRGDAIYLYGRLLLDMMLYGSKQSNSICVTKSSIDDSLAMQVETHQFFVSGGDETADGSNDWEERRLRVNTGGPVFELEENDLLGATSINVVCELAAVLKPAVVTPYCSILVELILSVLKFDNSRPVRRAAASLARELYVSVENEICNKDDTPPTVSMAVALVCCRESTLYDVLRSCVVSGHTGNVGDGSLYIDAATQSRCNEAIEVRDNLESMSVFGAAALVAESLRVENEPVVRAVREALSR